MAHLYEETRAYDPLSFKAAVDDLTHRFPPAIYRSVFEPGIGSGRIAIPLAQTGYQVTGVDISDRMLQLLRQRLARTRHLADVNIQKADAVLLPFRDNAFDMAFAIHFFYFVRNWKKAADEIRRVVKASSPIVLMHTGNGLEVPNLTKRYRDLCAAYGHPVGRTGVSSTGEVLAYYRNSGCKALPIRREWHFASHIRIENALGFLKSRAYSFTVSTPDAVHSAVMEHLVWETTKKYGTLTAKISVPNKIYYTAVIKP